MTTCYDTATGCRHYGSGAWHLRDFLDGKYDGWRSLGIANCRKVNKPGGSTRYSVHAEERALDWGVPLKDNGQPWLSHPEGDQIVTNLIAAARVWEKQAGRSVLQYIIWDRRKYGCSWGWGPRNYGGYNHEDHLHIELTRFGAKWLTRQRIEAVLGGDDMTPEQAKKLDEVHEWVMRWLADPPGKKGKFNQMYERAKAIAKKVGA